MRNHKVVHRIEAGFLSLLLAVMNSVAVSAQSDSDYSSQIAQREAEIEQMKKENDKRQAEINSYSGDISGNEEMISLISEQIDSVKSEILSKNQLIGLRQEDINQKSDEISDLEAKIAIKDGQIKEKQAEIDNLESENRANLKKYAKLVRVLYMNDTSQTIPLLNGSDDWYNFFVYSDVVRNISKQNMEFMQDLKGSIKTQEDMISDLNEEISSFQNDKQDIENSKAALEKEKASLESKKSDLEKYSQEKYQDLLNVSTKNDALLNRVASLEYSINATNELIEEANREIEEMIRKSQSDNPDRPIYSTNGFRWPLDSKYQYITGNFGSYILYGKVTPHRGMDIGNAGIGGAPIYAVQSGTVINAYNDGGYHGGYGNYVSIDHGGGISTLYAHCFSTTVYAGQTVEKGDVIGYVGTTGLSTGNHLHLEVRVDGTATDPAGYSYEFVD